MTNHQDKTRTHASGLLRLSSLMLAGTAAIAIATPALAQQTNWDGSEGNDWTDGDNWSSGTVPTNEANIGRPLVAIIAVDTDTTPTPIITEGQDVSVRNLKVGNGDDGIIDLLTGGRLQIGDTVNGGSLEIGLTTSPFGVINSSTGLVNVAGGRAQIFGTLSLGTGFDSSGTLRVDNRGVVRTTSLCLACGNANFAGTGLIDLDGLATFVVTGEAGVIRIGEASGTGGTGVLRIRGGSLVEMAGGVGDVLGVGSEIEVSGNNGAGVTSQLVWNGSLTAHGNITVTDGALTDIGVLTLTDTAELSVSNGARLNQVAGESGNWGIGQQALVQITGAGTELNVNGALSINSSNGGAGSADFVIASGATVNVNSASASGLAFGEERFLIVNDSTLNMAGGLLMNFGNLLATNATLNFGGGNVTMGSFFDGNSLSLFDTDITAAQISTGGSVTGFGNIINLGGTASGPAGAVGAFNVGAVQLSDSTGGVNVPELVINHTASGYEIASVLSGSGGVIRHIAGDTIFSGASDNFAGRTQLTSGSLSVDGLLGNPSHVMEVSGGAVLGGSGTIGGVVEVTDGTIAPGNGPVTLLFAGSLLLDSASILEFELGIPTGVEGLDSDLIVVGGDLTLDGTLNIANIGGFGSGLYRLINYGGALSDNGLEFGSVPLGFESTGLTLDLATAGQVNLLAVAAEPDFDFIFWDGSSTSSNGRIDGGSGIWSVADTNWTTLDGENNGAFDPADFLIFRAPEEIVSAGPQSFAAATPSSSTGTVTIDNTGGQVSLENGVQFAVTGYTVTGGAIRLDGPDAVIVRVGGGSAESADFVATIVSALTGDAGLAKTDLGTLILSGSNTYTGGTIVEGGVLQGNSDSLQGEFAIGPMGTLLFDQGANGIFSGTIVGDGSVVKEGAGTLTVAGQSSAYNGATQLAAGGLLLTGSLGGQLTTAAGTVLSGDGQTGALDLSGALSPGTGSGIATFDVNGSAIFRAGSVLSVDLAADGSNDSVLVDDTATILGGTVAINLLDPDTAYIDGTVFTFLEAEEGLTGAFDGLTEDSAFLDFTLGYTAETAFLTLNLIRQFPDVALTFNQRQASLALMELDQTAGSDSLAVYNALLMLDAESARAAFDLASGEIYADLVSTGNRAVSARAFGRLQDGAERGREGWDAWIGGGLSNGRVSDDGNGARVTRDDRDLELGLDYHGAGNRWAAGVSGGWMSSDVDNATRGSYANLDGWFVSGFARYGDFAKGPTLALSATHTDTDGTVQRAISFGTLMREAVAPVDLSSTAITAQMRYGFGSETLAAGPSISVEYAHTSLDAYTESGAGALALSGAGASDSWTRFGGGAFVAFTGKTTNLQFDLQYLTGSEDDSSVFHSMAGSAQVFEVRPARGSGDLVRLAGQFETRIGERASVTLGGQALLGDEETALSGTASFRIAF